MKTPFIIPLLIIALALSSCKPSVDKLSDVSIPDYILIPQDEKDGVMKEVKEVVQHYIDTGDALYASPKHHITVLHLAALERDISLVKHLLQQGANPNARLLIDGKEADTPIALALSAAPYESNIGDALLIERTLFEAGADLNIPGFWGRSPLSIYAKSFDDFIYQTDEDIPDVHLHGRLAIELMKMGAHAGENEVRLFAKRGWKHALECVFATADGAKLRRDAQLLHECAETVSDNYCSERSIWRDKLLNNVLECAELILQEPELADMPDQHGKTVLFKLAKHFSIFRIEKDQPHGSRFMALLIQKGANPYRPSGDYGKTCAADHIAAVPFIQKELRASGFDISPPHHRFSEETMMQQLSDIPPAAISTEEIQEQFEVLARLFGSPLPVSLAPNPDEEDDFRSYLDVCDNVLELLHRADAERTLKLIMQHPSTLAPEAWQGTAVVARGLLRALQRNRDIVLPATWLAETARHLDAQGERRAAHAYARLMSRDSGEEASRIIEELCSEETPLALRAAAWSCKLQKADLPTSDEEMLERWFQTHHRQNIADYPEFASLLTACDSNRYWLDLDFRYMVPERLRFECCYPTHDIIDNAKLNTICAALDELGVVKASAFCRKLHAFDNYSWKNRLNNPLMADNGPAADASLELEWVLSRHIWEHRQKLLSPRKTVSTENWFPCLNIEKR